MLNIQNKVIVPYSAKQMFILVNDIASYSDFIPGCVGSRILVGDDCKLIAEMDVFRFGVSYSFVTQNFMVKNERIIIKLIRGPLKSLFGVWRFTCLTYCSEVECNFSCEFQSITFERMFNYIIKQVVHDVMNSFIFRAHIMYE